MSNSFNLFGDIVATDADRWTESDVTPGILVGWLKKQGDADVEININSLGGDVTAGLAIANAIKAHKGHTTANVLGVAASMASVIACACDELKMGEGSFLMIHNPWTITMGNAEALRSEAEVLDKMRDSILGFYQSKTEIDAEQLKALMDAESWLNAEDLKANGFAFGDYITEMKAAAHCLTRGRFSKVPEKAKVFFDEAEKPAAPAPAPAAEPEKPADETANKRLAGLQAAKDREIAALREEFEDYKRRSVEALAAADAQAKEQLAAKDAEIAQFKTDIDAKSKALDHANAKIEQLETKCADAAKVLAATQAALATAEQRYRDQVGAALQQPEVATGSQAASSWRKAYADMRREKSTK